MERGKGRRPSHTFGMHKQQSHTLPHSIIRRGDIFPYFTQQKQCQTQLLPQLAVTFSFSPTPWASSIPLPPNKPTAISNLIRHFQSREPPPTCRKSHPPRKAPIQPTSPAFLPPAQRHLVVFPCRICCPFPLAFLLRIRKM